MAQLKRSGRDGHLFILAGQSQGTWQVSEKGEQWLRLNHYLIPDQGKHVYIDAGTFSYLKDIEYLYIHGNEYDHNGIDASFEAEQILARAIKGLPMLLRLKGGQEAVWWELYLDLTELYEEVWEELRSHQTEMITATSASPVARKRLFFNDDGLLPIYPFPRDYEIYSVNSDKSKRRLEQAPETPGLKDNWQGNIFLERITQIGSWQRYLPGTTANFSGELLWLAKAECKPDWHGQTIKVGNPKIGWQLWSLTASETNPTSWESIENWFRYHSINILPMRQRLEIVSPPSLVNQDGQYTFQIGNSLWLACYPPDKQTQGIFRKIALSTEQVASTSSNSSPPSRYVSDSYPADDTYYLCWSTDQPGDYHIRIQGDASAEPLRVKVALLTTMHPSWLHGLSCTVKAGEVQQILTAFNDSDSYTDPLYIMDQFAKEELAGLEWTYEPAGLPLSIAWKATSTESEREQKLGEVYLARSSEELTWYWKEKISPVCSMSTHVQVALDAGSFGSITLSITIPQQEQVEPVLSGKAAAVAELPEGQQVESQQWVNKRLRAQFVLLSRIIQGKHALKSPLTPMPVQLSEKLLRLSRQPNVKYSFRATLEQLASTYLVPSWVLFRLEALIAEIEATDKKEVLH